MDYSEKTPLRDEVDPFRSHASFKYAEADHEVRAERLAGEQRCHVPLHFSRKITLEKMTQRSLGTSNIEPLNTGKGGTEGDIDLPYLALCRVLLYRTYEVEGPITDADIIYAADSDYDSVHSSQWSVLWFVVA